MSIRRSPFNEESVSSDFVVFATRLLGADEREIQEIVTWYTNEKGEVAADLLPEPVATLAKEIERDFTGKFTRKFWKDGWVDDARLTIDGVKYDVREDIWMRSDDKVEETNLFVTKHTSEEKWEEFLNYKRERPYQ